MNLMTPVGTINKFILGILAFFPAVFPEGHREKLQGAVWNYANTAGNPLHFLTSIAIFAFAIVKSISPKWRLPR